MKRYPVYKDAGTEGLGEIPSHWNLLRGKRLFKQVSRPVRDLDEVITAFRDGTVTARSNRRTEGFTNAILETGYQGIRKGDLVIHAMDAFAGAIGVSDSDGKATPVYAVCTPLNAANPYYYAQLLRCMACNGYILSLAKGIRERSTDFRFAEFAALKLPVPPIEEQAVIVTFLNRKLTDISNFITQKARLIALLKEQKAAIINRAVTKGIETNVLMKPSGIEWLEEVPAHWEVKRVKYLVKIERGIFTHRPRNDPLMYDGPYPFIQTGDVRSTNKYIKDYHQTLNDAGLSVSKLFPKGTLVMTIAANVADVGILEFDACFPDSLVGLIPRELISIDYLFYLFKGMRNELLRTAPINTQLNLNVDQIGALWNAVPPWNEQGQIVAYIEAESARIDSAIIKAEREIELIKEYRTTLISDAVTGKIDVRAATREELPV